MLDEVGCPARGVISHIIGRLERTGIRETIIARTAERTARTARHDALAIAL